MKEQSGRKISTEETRVRNLLFSGQSNRSSHVDAEVGEQQIAHRDGSTRFMTEAMHEANPKDIGNLKMLSIFYYISAGLAVLGIFFGMFYIFFASMMTQNLQHTPEAEQMGDMMTGIFTIIGLVIVFFSAIYSVISFLAARYLTQHRNHTFCMIVAGLTCLNVPLGTVLGVFTFIVLNRPSARELFDRAQYA